MIDKDTRDWILQVLSIVAAIVAAIASVWNNNKITTVQEHQAVNSQKIDEAKTSADQAKRSADHAVIRMGGTPPAP